MIVNDARYKTAPMVPAMSVQNNFFNALSAFLANETHSTETKRRCWSYNAYADAYARTTGSLRRDNSLTLRDPGSTPATTNHQATMQPSTSNFYQTQLSQPQPQLSREPSTRWPQPFLFPEPAIRSPTSSLPIGLGRIQAQA